MSGWIIWVGLFVVVIGFAVYRTDKKLKQKFEDKFNPHEWDLPDGAAATPPATTSVTAAAPLVAARAPAPVYHRQAHWFSAEQAQLFRLLQQALAGEYVLLAKIHLRDLVTAPAMFETRLQRRVDFVVCGLRDMAPLCLVQLEDPLAQASDTAQLEEICRSVQLPLFSLAGSNPPTSAELRQQLLAAMGIVAVAPADEHKTCPLCGAAMRQRQVTSGAQAGRRLWVCTTYPACKGWVALGE